MAGTQSSSIRTTPLLAPATMPMTMPTVRSAALHGLADLVRAAHVDYDELLRRQGLDAALMADPEYRIRFRQYLALLDAAAAATGDDFIGLHLGATQPIQAIGLLGYAHMAAPDVRTQLTNAARYFALHQEGAAIELRVDGDMALMTYSLFDPQVTLHRHDAESTLALVVCQWRSMTGQPGWTPTSVHFEHPMPGNDRELRRLFGCPVYFSERFDGLRFPTAFLDTPIRSADPSLLAILARYAEDSLARHGDGTTLLGRTRRLIAAALGSGGVTIDEVARHLAMTPRTLQRRLIQQGVQFSDLVDNTRRDLAVQYLRDPRISLTDTAFLVGYSDLTAFHRAFRRWFNQTPLEYQREALKT